MDVLADLLVMLVLAKFFGAMTERMGQPSSVGELLAGMVLATLVVLLGPQFPFLTHLPHSEVLTIVGNLGIFMLMLVAGIELEPTEISGHSAASFAVALGGMLVPLFGGIAVIWFFLPDTEMRVIQAVVVGTALSISAIPASIKVLADLNMLHTVIGRTIIAAAMFDDVLGLFVLTVLLAILESGQTPDLASLAWLLIKVFLFFGVTILLGVHVYPHVRRGLKAMQVAAMDLSALALVGLAYSWLAEALGLHWIMGAFMAGLYFEKSRVGAVAYNELRLICGAMTAGFFGPLFFVYIGIQVDLLSMAAAPLFVVVLLLAALLGKLLGAGLPALWFDLTPRQALSVGVGLNARGAVEFIFVSIAFQAGLFTASGSQNGVTESLYTALITVGVVTTLAVPILLPAVVPKQPDE